MGYIVVHVMAATECDCPMQGETPADEERCMDEKEQGVICSKPDGHDGPHAACNVAEHPMEVWE